MDTKTIPHTQYVALLHVAAAALQMRRLEKWDKEIGGQAVDAVAVVRRVLDEALAALEMEMKSWTR